MKQSGMKSQGERESTGSLQGVWPLSQERNMDISETGNKVFWRRIKGWRAFLTLSVNYLYFLATPICPLLQKDNRLKKSASIEVSGNIQNVLKSISAVKTFERPYINSFMWHHLQEPGIMRLKVSSFWTQCKCVSMVKANTPAFTLYLEIKGKGGTWAQSPHL